MAAAALARSHDVWPAFCVIVALSGVVEVRSLRRLTGRGFLAFAVVSAGLMALSGEPGGWTAAGPLIARGGMVVVGFGALADRASPAALEALACHLRLPGFGLALGIALNSLDALRDTATDTWHALRLRGATRAGLRRAARLYAVALLGAVLARADAVAVAAVSRGCDRRGERVPAAEPATTADRLVGLLAWLPALALLLRRAGAF